MIFSTGDKVVISNALRPSHLKYIKKTGVITLINSYGLFEKFLVRFDDESPDVYFETEEMSIIREDEYGI